MTKNCYPSRQKLQHQNQMENINPKVIHIYLNSLYRRLSWLTGESSTIPSTVPRGPGCSRAVCLSGISCSQGLAQGLRNTELTLCRTPVQATHKQFPVMEANRSFRALRHRCFSLFNAQVSYSEEVCGTKASKIHYKACSSGEFTSPWDNDLLFHEQRL